MTNGNYQGRQMMTLGAPPLPTLWTRLPVGGWQVGFLVDETGRTLVDVADPTGMLARRLAGNLRASLSIEAGWSGTGFGSDGRVHHWALAIGRLPTGLSHTSPTPAPHKARARGPDDGALAKPSQMGYETCS